MDDMKIARGILIGFVISLCLGWTYTFDTTQPTGSSAPSLIDDYFRNDKLALQERLNTDHIFPLSAGQVSDADAGMHRDIHFYSTTATDPILGVTAVDGTDELRYTNSDGSTVYLTSGNTLNIQSSDLTGTLANNTYFTAVDNAGTGTVDLIKANASDVAVLPDGSELATSGAPTADADIANKKYVDDQVAEARLTYSGDNVFNGALSSANTWQSLDLSAYVGARRALCYAKVTAGGSCVWMWGLTETGTANWHSSYVGSNSTVFSGTSIAYVTFMTHSDGTMKHVCSSQVQNITIQLLGYIY